MRRRPPLFRGESVPASGTPPVQLHALRLMGIWGPACLLMAAIFVFSSMSELPLSLSPAGLSDKVIHAVVYAVLGALMLRGLADGRWSGVTAATAVGAMMLSTLYGCTDEVHQSVVPGRTPELADVLVDSLGAGCAVAALRAWSIIRTSRSAHVPQPPA